MMYNTASPVWEKPVSNPDITIGWSRQATVWWSYSSNTTVHGMLDSLLNIQHATHSSTPTTIIFCQHNDHTLSTWWESELKCTPSFGSWNSMFNKNSSLGYHHHHQPYSPGWALAFSLGYITVNQKSLLHQVWFIYFTDTQILFSTTPKKIYVFIPFRTSLKTQSQMKSARVSQRMTTKPWINLKVWFCFPKSFPPFMLHSHPCLKGWAKQCTHIHGCPLDHFQYLCHFLQSCTKGPLEHGTEQLSQNVNKEIPLLAA